MFERILVPLDGSEAAEEALPLAEAWAHRTGAPLHLVRVIDPAGLGPLGTVMLHTDALAMQLLLEEERIAARAYLERVEQEVRDRQHAVTVEYRQGPAAQELLAITQPGDLLVMATHGRGGLARWFLGSVAETVVRRATVPVCLVRASDIAPRPFAIDRLVVPLDGSPLAEEALPTALSLAKRLQTPIHLITVIDVSGGAPMELAAAAVSARRFEETVTRHFTDAQALLAQPHERLQEEGVVTSVEVRHGVPGAAIVDAVLPGDFIVMTSHGRTGPPRWFLGSVAEAVIRHASVPVLLVRTTPSAPASSAGDSSEQ